MLLSRWGLHLRTLADMIFLGIFSHSYDLMCMIHFLISFSFPLFSWYD